MYVCIQYILINTVEAENLNVSSSLVEDISKTNLIRIYLMVIYMNSNFGIFFNINNRLFCLFSAENSLMVVFGPLSNFYALYASLFSDNHTPTTSLNHRSQIFKKFVMINFTKDLYNLCIFTNIFLNFTIQFAHLISNNLIANLLYMHSTLIIVC